jgi:CRISPR locus-related DNA-binding protein
MKSDLRVHIATVGFQVKRIAEPLIRERADKVYLINHSNDDKAVPYLEKILKILRKEKFLKVEKRTTNIWDLFDCLQTYKKIIKEEQNAHIYINVSTGSKVSSIAGTLACMIWKGTPYYAHIDYSDKKDTDDGLPDENVISLVELPVYSINRPKPESLFVLKALSEVKGGKLKKSKLIEQLEEAGLIDKDLSIAAKHSKLKGLLNPISIAGGLDNPMIEVEYRGRQSNVILTTQGESTLKIFG